MPTPLLNGRKAVKISSPPGYGKLRDDVRKILVAAQERIDREKVLTYWKAGKRISGDILKHKDRAGYGKSVILRLSRDLGISDRVLWQSIQFYRSFPIVNRGSQLVWAHYRALARISDRAKRLEFTRAAKEKGWTAEELSHRITQKFGKRENKPVSFKPKLGRLGVYRVVFSEGLLLDLGFSSFVEHPALAKGRFKEGDIVNASVIASPPKAGEAISLLKNATPADLYTYQAEVEKVVDGDTLWLWIHLGFNFWVRQKVRLRGIDAQELQTQAGLSAKRFVESRLAPVKEIVVTTTKPDKYDRYLSDVWIGDKNLNKLLLDSGHARLKSDFFSGDWNLENWGRF